MTQTQTQTQNVNHVKQVTQMHGSRHKPQSNIASKSEGNTKDKLFKKRTSIKTPSSSLNKNTTNTPSRKNTPSATRTDQHPWVHGSRNRKEEETRFDLREEHIGEETQHLNMLKSLD